ncbi:M50 family metallopeptidase [Paenibacillus sp. HB172176]|uniref:M50 family metallopeptidase n=1 Tax=Paenibacillus sp. HB172176 TaxID=2493690 RepID=UPI00143B8B7D|nr:M50 family metallopeptidase [Paenibacillus sp. HB172176]
MVHLISWFRTTLLLFAVLVLTRFIPFSSFFRNVNTLVHELSHAAAALLLQGKVMEIHLYGDQSGVTYTQLTEGWSIVPVASAGYIGAALFSAMLFALYARGQEKLGLIIIALLAGIALILFVRNGYGAAWCAGFTVITGLVALLAPRWAQKVYYLLLAFLCLVESVVSSFVIAYLAALQPYSAGDATSLDLATGIPAIVWALAFLVIALVCFKSAMGRLFRGGKRETERQNETTL